MVTLRTGTIKAGYTAGRALLIKGGVKSRENRKGQEDHKAGRARSHLDNFLARIKTSNIISTRAKGAVRAALRYFQPAAFPNRSGTHE